MKLIPLVILAVSCLTGSKDNKCDGTWCVRITNQHQENDQPVHVQLRQATGFISGLYLHEVSGMQLAPGADTGWFDASQGTSRSCGGDDVCYMWRAQATDAWSTEPVCRELEGTPNCFEKGNNYDLVLP